MVPTSAGQSQPLASVRCSPPGDDTCLVPTLPLEVAIEVANYLDLVEDRATLVGLLRVSSTWWEAAARRLYSYVNLPKPKFDCLILGCLNEGDGPTIPAVNERTRHAFSMIRRLWLDGITVEDILRLRSFARDNEVLFPRVHALVLRNINPTPPLIQDISCGHALLFDTVDLCAFFVDDGEYLLKLFAIRQIKTYQSYAYGENDYIPPHSGRTFCHVWFLLAYWAPYLNWPAPSKVPIELQIMLDQSGVEVFAEYYEKRWGTPFYSGISPCPGVIIVCDWDSCTACGKEGNDPRAPSWYSYRPCGGSVTLGFGPYWDDLENVRDAVDSLVESRRRR